METMPEFTKKDPPFNGSPNPLHNFKNVGRPYMFTLSLPRFNIGLLVWLFSTSLIQNTQTISPKLSKSSQHHQPLVNPLPSSPNISSSIFSSSLG